MLNQVVVVGRLTKMTKIEEEGNAKKCVIELAVPRCYKNDKGEYDTDFVDCILFNNIADQAREWCTKGDLVGIKGRIQSKTVKMASGDIKEMQIIAEKVTFLSKKGVDSND